MCSHIKEGAAQDIPRVLWMTAKLARREMTGIKYGVLSSRAALLPPSRDKGASMSEGARLRLIY